MFNKKIINNFSYLFLIQIITLLVPFMYYPYIIRKYEITEYGLIVFIQSIIALLAIIVDFGFNISGTRSASENRDKKLRLNIIYSSITYIKILLFFICFMIYQVLILLNTKLNDNYLLSNFLFLTVLGEALFSQWLYLGLEKIKFAAIINLFSRFILLIVILIGTNTTLGFFSFPLALVLSSALNGIISIYFVRKRLKVNFVKVSIIQMKRDLIKSYSFLLSRSVGVFILKLNTYLIGNYIGLAQVAYYDLAEKLINLALMPLNILNQVLYPNIARSKNFRLTFTVILVLLTIYLLSYPIVYFLGEYIIVLFAGNDMREAFPYLLILYLIPVTCTITYFSGNCALVLVNKKQTFNNSIYLSALLYIFLILGLLLSSKVTIITLCWALVFNAIVTCIHRATSCYIYRDLFKLKKTSI